MAFKKLIIVTVFCQLLLILSSSSIDAVAVKKVSDIVSSSLSSSQTGTEALKPITTVIPKAQTTSAATTAKASDSKAPVANLPPISSTTALAATSSPVTSGAKATPVISSVKTTSTGKSVKAAPQIPTSSSSSPSPAATTPNNAPVVTTTSASPQTNSPNAPQQPTNQPQSNTPPPQQPTDQPQTNTPPPQQPTDQPNTSATDDGSLPTETQVIVQKNQGGTETSVVVVASPTGSQQYSESDLGSAPRESAHFGIMTSLSIVVVSLVFIL